MTKTTKPAAKKAAAPKTPAAVIAAAADTTLETKEYADGTTATGVAPLPDESPTADAAPLGVYTLELARALPEVEFNPKAVVFESEDRRCVTKFGSADETRLMQVVHVAGGLAQMPIDG